MTAINLDTPEVYVEDTPLNLTDIVIADATTATATLTLSDAAAGALSTGTSGGVTSTYDSATGVWSASGPIADVNALLAAVTFTPAQNFNGSFSIATSVSDDVPETVTGSKLITGTAVNDAPIAVNDSYTTTENTALTVAAPGILGNDTDVDGDPLTASVVSPPANGAVTLDTATGSFTYTPAANFNGTDSFIYQVNDGTANSNFATVILTVSVNDAPVAVDDSYTTTEDTALTVAAPGILGNDTDVNGDALTAFVVSPPANGTVTLDVATGAFVYTPAPNFNGTDSFTYEANDGTANSNFATVTLTVSPVNDAPVAADDSYTTTENTALTVPAGGILANDTDVDGDALTVSLVSGPAHGTVALNADGAFTYTPAANFNGTDSFTYQANDGTANSNVATVSLTVSPTAEADLFVSKAVSNPTPNVGDTIIFTVTLTDQGPDAATNVVVTDVLPAGLTFLSATPTLGTYNNGTGLWDVGTVIAGASQTLTITARVDSPAALTNTGTITGADQFDPDATNNTASATETPQQADLFVSKSVSNPTPNVGETIAFIGSCHPAQFRRVPFSQCFRA